MGYTIEMHVTHHPDEVAGDVEELAEGYMIGRTPAGWRHVFAKPIEDANGVRRPGQVYRAAAPDGQVGQQVAVVEYPGGIVLASVPARLTQYSPAPVACEGADWA